jgi:peptide/nickel transport system substrate-binding protein
VAKLPADTMPTLESHILISESTEGRHLVANPYFHQVDTAGNQLPYISEQDEIFVNEDEVRLLKLVNAEVDFKAQSLQLSTAPLLLENQEKGDYKVDLRPEITILTFGINMTHENLEKRKVFSDLRFRQAMSVAINREEINEVAGLKDVDGDGFLELPNGDKLVINLQFAVQGAPAALVELVGQHWGAVGIQTTVKEVTPDEYRSAQSSNKLDVTMWRNGQPLAIVLGTNQIWVPPYEWIDSNGASGVEPPDYAKQMIKDINAFQSTPVGTPESDKLGARLVENLVSNLLFIGTVQVPAPIYHRNVVKNFVEYKTHSFEYYRSYPYRPTQWWLDE